MPEGTLDFAIARGRFVVLDIVVENYRCVEAGRMSEWKKRGRNVCLDSILSFCLVACQLRAAVPCAFANVHVWRDASAYSVRTVVTRVSSVACLLVQVA